MRGVDVVLLDAGEVSGGTTGLGEGNVLCSDKAPGPQLDLCLHGLRMRRSAPARRASCRLEALPRRAAWAGLRPWLRDHRPAIGPSKAVERVWLATGHEGARVALGPVTGRLIAQAYCGEPSPIDPEAFYPDRFG